MPPAAPAGRCATPAHRGLRGTRGTVMPDPSSGPRAGGSGPRARQATLRWGCGRQLPEGWSAAPVPALPTESSGVRRPSTRGPCSGSCPRVLGGCRDARTGARTAGVSVTWEHPGEALTAVPCCPPVPGSRWHRALPPTSPWKVGAGVPEDLRGRQPGLRSPGSLGAAWCSHPRAELSQTEPPQGPPGDGVGPGGRKGSKEPVASTQG